MHARLLAVVYYACVFLAITTHTQDFSIAYYASIIFAAVVMFAVTYFRDAKNPNRPDWKYRTSCSVAASYLAYWLYPSVKGVEVDLLLWKIHPFETIQIFVGLCSYFGITIFKEISALNAFGWRTYIGKLADKLKAISTKHHDQH